jgi:hypothetical protein
LRRVADDERSARPPKSDASKSRVEEEPAHDSG